MNSMKMALLIACVFIPLYPQTNYPPSEDFFHNNWRGIIPLHSTREDVGRILGETPDGQNNKYYLKGVNVFLIYSRGGCVAGKPGGWNVPAGTVIRVTVASAAFPKFSKLEIDKAKFKAEPDPEVKLYTYYVNKTEGLMLSVCDDRVTTIDYFPPENEDYLRCPNHPR